MIRPKGKTVKDLIEEETARIVKFNDQNFICRFYTLGIRLDRSISLVRKAPFGGACYVRVEDSLIALRKNEADSILVQ